MPSRMNLMLSYALLVFIWATTPLAIVWSVADLHPMWALVLRFFIALPLAATILMLLRVQFPTHKIALFSYIAGSLSLIGSQIFTYAATAYLSSGLIALMFGLAPIMAGLIGRFAFQQKLAGLQWLGMGTSIAGLALICLSGSQKHGQPIGSVLMLMSVFASSLSIFLVKKINAPISGSVTSVGALWAAAVLFLLAWLLLTPAGELWPQSMSDRAWGAIVYLALFGSVFGFMLFFFALRHLPASLMGLVTLLAPVLALWLGWWFEGEVLSVAAMLGTRKVS